MSIVAIVAPGDVHVLCTLHLFSSSLPPLCSSKHFLLARYAYDCNASCIVKHLTYLLHSAGATPDGDGATGNYFSAITVIIIIIIAYIQV